MKKLFFFLCICVFLFSGCGKKYVGSTASGTGVDILEAGVSQDKSYHDGKSYTLYVEDPNYILSMYEPKEGCYLGAYILSNNTVNFDISAFENLTEKRHALYMYTMHLGGVFPTQWFLSCLSLMKTPYVTIIAPNDYNPFDISLLETTAKELAEFYVPVFVDFYPNPESKGYKAEEYIEFYQKAREIFRENASNVAFVWSVGQDEAVGSHKYYPGIDYVDWVGVQVYQSILPDGAYSSDPFAAIDYMYFTYQKDKPLIISNYAVSHFSNLDNVYRTREAANEISSFYSRIADDYPRIKAVNYMDFSSIEISRDRMSGDNFSITGDNFVNEQYVKSISGSYFLSELDFSSTGDANTEVFKSPFPAYKIGDDFFISSLTVLYDLKINGIAGYADKRESIGGQIYYDMHTLEVNNAARISRDEEDKKILVKK